MGVDGNERVCKVEGGELLYRTSQSLIFRSALGRDGKLYIRKLEETSCAEADEVTSSAPCPDNGV